MSELLRTFICIDLPASLKARLEAFEQPLKESSRGRVSWVKADNVHLTLRFLGDIAAARIAELTAAVTRGAQGRSSFTLTATGTGAFPQLRNPRVFWIGLKGDIEQLMPLHADIEKELVASGFGRADKPFSPHLTIGRARQGNARDIGEAFAKLAFADEVFPVNEIIVMRSQLNAGGSIYTPLAKIKLAS